MNKLLKSLLREKHHSILAVLMALFIILDVKIPFQMANLIDTIVGKTVIIILIFALLTFNKFVGVLAIVAGYMLVMRSMNMTGNKNMRYLDNENTKYHKMQNLNVKHNRSVEEDVIDNMLPRVANENVLSSDFKPIQGNLYDAEKL
jgi:ABC-type multidrug transport system fused ATPase/permease subunit